MSQVADCEDVDPWERWFRILPFPLLAVATVIALATGPATGSVSPTWRLAAQLVLVAAVAAWLWWWTYAHPAWRTDLGRMAVYYVGRSALAFGLTLLNPLFCIFAWIGFTDANDFFRRRALWAAMGATAVAMAIGQSGGVPWDDPMQGVLFAALLVVNFALASTFSRFAAHLWQTSEDRAQAITELERVNADLQRALAENAQLHETVLAQARAAGVQEERQRLAREIHDTIAQSLAGVVAQLQALETSTTDGAVRQRVERIARLAREALADARRSVLDLVPAQLSDTALPEAVTALVTEWAADHPAKIDLVVTGDPRALHPEVEATVLRITQEALSNVAKHADARRVGVTLSYDEEEVILDVRDDGVGFDPTRAAGPTSFGLRGMRQRAERLAGVLDMESEPGGGTAVSLRLPALQRGAA